MNTDTLVNTDGAPGASHGQICQDTIPVSTAISSSYEIRGPPESP